jgi:hypothetical protein
VSPGFHIRQAEPSRFRAFYGAAPLHLVAIIGCFVIIATAFANWFHTRAHAGNILVWFAGCLLAVEFILIPAAWALDRITSGPASRRITRHRRGAGCAYIRVPAMLSGLLLIVFLPLILRLGTPTFHAYTGSTPSIYLARWLETSAALFAISALLYAARHARKPRPPGRSKPNSKPQP